MFRWKLVFITDGSFYSSRSHLISAAWLISFSEKIVGPEDFISLVKEAYQYLFAVEIYSILSIVVTINAILLRYLYPSAMMQLEIRLDCQSVINNLNNTS